MAIFDRYTTDIFIAINEKTHEEYGKEKFKKKYNFKPDETNSSKGTIIVDGKKYNIDIDAKDTDSGNKDFDGISLDKRFFKVKSSNKSERHDAILQHEIGHKNLHSIDSKSNNMEARNKSKKFFREKVDKMVEKKYNTSMDTNAVDIAKKLRNNPRVHSALNRMSNDRTREFIYKNEFNEDEYLKDTASKDQERRDGDYEKAKKYEKSSQSHIKAEEFEADRYAANRTLEGALKRGLANYNKLSKKDSNISEKASPKEVEEDYQQRSKALKDKDLRDAKTYK